MMLYLYVDSLSEAVYVQLSVCGTFLFVVIMFVCQVFFLAGFVLLSNNKLQTQQTTCGREVCER